MAEYIERSLQFKNANVNVGEGYKEIICYQRKLFNSYHCAFFVNTIKILMSNEHFLVINRVYSIITKDLTSLFWWGTTRITLHTNVSYFFANKKKTYITNH